MSAEPNCGFDVHAVGIDDNPDIDTFTVGIADAEVPTRALLFQIRLSPFEDDDINAGWATYCITDEAADVVYGGVDECVLDNRTLTLSFDDNAQAALGTGPRCIYRLLVDDAHIEVLRTGLRRVLTGGFNQTGMPARLVLDN